MIRPRWRKVFSDLWGNKIRTLLVIASIAVGLYAIGIIATMQAVLLQDMRTGYASYNPANIQFTTSSFDQDLLDRVRRIDGVRQAEGARVLNYRLEASPGEWIAISLKAVHDIEDMSIDKVLLEQGRWPPQELELVIDRFKLPDTNAKVGDMVTLELPSGKTRQLQLVGVTHDETIGSEGAGGGFFLAPVQGYIHDDTLKWLEQPDTMNTLYVTVTGDSRDRDYLNQVAERVRDEIESNNVTVISKAESSSFSHPNETYVEAIAGVLILLGLLVVFLSGFLITNTLSALLNQQMEQIGVMKTIGARRGQIVFLYMLLIFVFGLVAFLIAVPLSYYSAYALLDFITNEINVTLQGYRFVPSAVILQAAIALLVPQLAGFLPILHASGISVQQAFSGEAQAAGGRNASQDNWLMRIRGLSRPLLISLRNAFRRKGRLALTLTTLTLGGAIFIATFSVRISLNQYIDQISRYFLADVNLTLDRPQRVDEIRDLLTRLPQVAEVEGWAQARTEVVHPDGSVGESVSLLAPPTGSRLVEPILLSGRWLAPGDENAIVLSERFRSLFPNLREGSDIRLKVNGKEQDWRVVGFFQLAGKSGGYLAYAPYEYVSSLIHQPFKASTFRVVARNKSMSVEEQKQFGREIETYLETSGYHVSDVTAGLFLREVSSNGLSILTAFLLFMASLIALVGSIGLTGTMSINVMERTREIGVMRAIGASNRTLMNMVIIEGMIIGLTSWVLGSLLAFPISKIMSDRVSISLFDAPSNFRYTATGFIVWLVAVIILSVLASVMPARNAARLTIREVLAYE